MTRPLSVLVVHNRYRSAQPSGEDRVVDQERELLTTAGHTVAVMERRSDDIAALPLREKAAVPFRVPWNPAARRELAERLRARRPDVVHVHSVFPLISPSVLAACTDAAVPVVATLHNYAQVCAPGTLYREGRVCTDCAATDLPALRHGCYRGSRVATLPVAVSSAVNRGRWWSSVHRFFCVSHSQRDLLVQGGMPADRLLVAHNFVPEPGRRRDGSAARHVLFLGRLTEEKGLRVLMEAWDRVGTRSRGLPLVIAGAGPMADEVARWARDRDDVRVVGLQDRAACSELIARAAAVVAPSVWLEAFGLVVVEAMAAGVPAVAAAHGAFVELVDDGVSGLLHRPGSAAALAAALAEVMVSPERNRRLGLAARARYEAGFTPGAGLARLTAGYRAAIDAARSPGRA